MYSEGGRRAVGAFDLPAPRVEKASRVDCFSCAPQITVGAVCLISAHDSSAISKTTAPATLSHLAGAFSESL